MKVYAIEIYGSGFKFNSKVSSEAYYTYKDAENFILSRADSPNKVSPYQYESEDRIYLIIEFDVVNLYTTVNDCSLIKQVGVMPRQYNGKCEGFQLSEYNDEPCEQCKKCKLNTSYEE